MESSCSLTKPEMDAVLQLIQLSGSSHDDLRLLWVDFAVERDRDGRGGGGGGVSAAAAEASSISSSSSVNQENVLDDEEEVLPRTNHKFGSLIEIYSKNRAKKKARF